MKYKEIIKNFEDSDNPIINQMISSSQDFLESYKKIIGSKLTEKSKINYVLKHYIIEINYTHKNGEVSNYRCSSNPYFIALLSSNKFSEYINLVKLIHKDLICNRTGHFATWDLVRNKRVEFITMKTKWNPINIIKISNSKSDMDLINKTFKRLIPRKTITNTKKNDLEELFG